MKIITIVVEEQNTEKIKTLKNREDQRKYRERNRIAKSLVNKFVDFFANLEENYPNIQSKCKSFIADTLSQDEKDYLGLSGGSDS